VVAQIVTQEISVKASVLALAALAASSAQAFAHSGHVPAPGGAHAFQHALTDLVVVAARVLAIGAGALITARARRRDR